MECDFPVTICVFSERTLVTKFKQEDLRKSYEFSKFTVFDEQHDYLPPPKYNRKPSEILMRIDHQAHEVECLVSLCSLN